MLVQINRQHVSPFAGDSLALELVQRLQSDGWEEVEYTAGPAVWEFDSVRQMFDFEKAFTAARLDITGPPYQWRVRFPCECWAHLDRPIPCSCGIVDETITEDNLRL